MFRRPCLTLQKVGGGALTPLSNRACSRCWLFETGGQTTLVKRARQWRHVRSVSCSHAVRRRK